ncbi:hypothetical protein RYX36_032234 [Vicia faba]
MTFELLRELRFFFLFFHQQRPRPPFILRYTTTTVNPLDKMQHRRSSSFMTQLLGSSLSSIALLIAAKQTMNTSFSSSPSFCLTPYHSLPSTIPISDDLPSSSNLVCSGFEVRKFVPQS